MTLTQLRYLVAIADCRLNITAAAEHVHATQPGVSKQLKQLEDELAAGQIIGTDRPLQDADAGAVQQEAVQRPPLTLKEKRPAL